MTLPLLTSALSLDQWTAATPNTVVRNCCSSARAIVLLMMFCGTRFQDLTFILHESLIKTRTHFEFVARIKTRRALTPIRVHKLSDATSICPYRALDAVVREETDKQQRLQHRAHPSGPIWTGPGCEAWDARRIAQAASRALKHAGVTWYRRPYKLKMLTASALVAAGVARQDVAKFIRHSTTSGNLDKYYVENDLGRGVAGELEKITRATQVYLFVC